MILLALCGIYACALVTVKPSIRRGVVPASSPILLTLSLILPLSSAMRSKSSLRISGLSTSRFIFCMSCWSAFCLATISRMSWTSRSFIGIKVGFLRIMAKEVEIVWPQRGLTNKGRQQDGWLRLRYSIEGEKYISTDDQRPAPSFNTVTNTAALMDLLLRATDTIKSLRVCFLAAQWNVLDTNTYPGNSPLWHQAPNRIFRLSTHLKTR